MNDRAIIYKLTLLCINEEEWKYRSTKFEYARILINKNYINNIISTVK